MIIVLAIRFFGRMNPNRESGGSQDGSHNRRSRTRLHLPRRAKALPLRPEHALQLLSYPVLVKCLQGHAGRDALTNRFLKTCDIIEEVSEPLARRAALLRRRAGRGSANDALVVAFAEPGGTVLTSDVDDLESLAEYAQRVKIERV